MGFAFGSLIVSGFLIHLHDSLSTVNVPLSLLISPSPYFRSASHVMSNLEVEAVDFELEEDDFMDEDVGAADVSPRAGHLRIRPAIYTLHMLHSLLFCCDL